MEALIAAIDEDPDDEERYLVLADALIAKGDPRGELIVMQHRLRGGELERAQRLVWDELERWRPTLWGVRWRWGFLDEVKVDVGEQPAAGVLEALCRAPAARWLRKLRVSTWDRERDGDPAMLAALPNLRELHIHNTVGFRDAELHALARLRRLEALWLGGGKVSPEAIATLPRVQLRELRFMNTGSYGDAHVAATPAWLRRLDIHVAKVTDAGMAHVPVRELVLSFCGDITSAVMRHLPALDSFSLTALELDGAELARMQPTLCELELDSVTNLEAALHAAARHVNLRALEVLGRFGERAPVAADTLARVLALPQLRKLKVRCIGAITGNAALDSRVEELSLMAAAIERDFAAQLARLPLVSLKLNGQSRDWNRWVDDELLAMLASSTRLERLFLRHTFPTDAGLAHLHGLARLTELDLCECGSITEAGVSALAAALPALESLDLGWCGQVRSLDGLAGHPGLVKIDIAATGIINMDVPVLATLPNLRELRLKRTAVTDAGIAQLPRTLRVLDLEDCKLTPRSFDTLCTFTSLERLCVRGTPVDAAALRVALPGCAVT